MILSLFLFFFFFNHSISRRVLFFFNFYLFIYFLAGWVFVATRGLSLVAASRATLRCGAWASHCGGFSCCRARALGVLASVVVALKLWLSSCGSRAQ